jgi:23S rRNA (guanosine2251-2'-O)-methyltransferase
MSIIMAQIKVLAHNIRSCHNIGAILRTSDGFGVEEVICSGYSPYPRLINKNDGRDDRLEYLIEKITKKIHKTALGAEEIVTCTHTSSIIDKINDLKSQGYTILGLELNERSIKLPDYKSPQKVALLLGEELHGLTPELLELCDELVEIPMFGQKESYNVSISAGIALYHLRCL